MAETDPCSSVSLHKITHFTCTMLASADISCHRVSILSVTSRCSTETAKQITQTTPHDSAGTLVFWRRKSRQNSNGITPNGGAKCRWSRLNVCAVAENWRLSMRSTVNLARLQVYHTQCYIISLQHMRCNAAYHAGLSVTADPCQNY